MREKIIAFRVSEDAYRRIKVKIAQSGATVQEIGMTLFANWLDRDKQKPKRAEKRPEV